MRRRLPFFALLIAALFVVVTATPAAACGGLVAPDGAVRLDHTSTLAAYHNGIETYITSFEYNGGSTNFGSIIPLPAAPTSVTRAGSWTLQRLEREVHPIPPTVFALGAARSAAASGAQVILQTTVDALDITVLKGGAPDVIQWIKEHGYFVSNDAPAMLQFYAARSPYFLAARFDAAKEAALGQQEGDGTPIEVTMPTASPWVPLHILTLAKTPEAIVTADVFLLTDKSPILLGIDPGVSVVASEPASGQLLSDLRSDKNSSWVPSSAWLTYVSINAQASNLNHDLAINPTGTGVPSAVEAGYLTPGTAPGRGVAAGLQPVTNPGGARPLSGVTGHGGVLDGTAALAVAAVFALLLVGLFAGWTALAAKRNRP
ncbi:MAG: DUF2330 domain-containing protein [Acidimicrobiales bacterium]